MLNFLVVLWTCVYYYGHGYIITAMGIFRSSQTLAYYPQVCLLFTVNEHVRQDFSGAIYPLLCRSTDIIFSSFFVDTVPIQKLYF